MKKSDPRLNRVCTLTLNGEIYNGGTVEIPADIWQTWDNDGENIYLPQNFSVGLNIENNDVVPLNATAVVHLNGLKKSEKILPAINLLNGQHKNFEIALGGMACGNGNFEVEIWLRTDNDAPLSCFWNGKNFGNKAALRIYLLDYAKLIYRKEKKLSSVFRKHTTNKNV